jgi:hypothetical protein
MGTITRGAKAGGGTNFNTGQDILPGEWNTDLNQLFTEVNGLLDDANIATAKIPGAKTLRFVGISTPGAPAASDVLLYANAAEGGGSYRLYTEDSAALVASFFGWAAHAVSYAEATTRSTVANTTIKTITTNIPVTDGFLLLCNARYNNSAADSSPKIGLAVNGTVVLTNQTMVVGASAPSNGLLMVIAWRRTSGYLVPSLVFIPFDATATTETSLAWRFPQTANWPNAAITSISLVGSVGDAADEVGVADAAVFLLQGT